MRLTLTKIPLLISYILVSAHTLVPHHHDDPAEAIQSHHDDGKDHNIFSFGEVDANFLPPQKQVAEHNDYPIYLFLILYNSSVKINSLSSDNEFPVFEEFPPPKNYFYSCSHRGPPIV